MPSNLRLSQLCSSSSATRDGGGGEKSCAWLTGTSGKTPTFKHVETELQNLPGKGPLTTKWLKGIVTTSIEYERVFSTVGTIVTKVRFRLNNDTVDALCFLKCHYR